MRTSESYRTLADMCRAGAANAKDSDYKRQMKKLQREFRELAEEAERTERATRPSASASPK